MNCVKESNDSRGVYGCACCGDGVKTLITVLERALVLFFSRIWLFSWSFSRYYRDWGWFYLKKGD